MTQTAPVRTSAESARQRTDRAEAIKQAWRVEGRPDAAVALRENPDLARDRAAAIDLAYEEFCVREEAGEVLDSAAFCARFSFGASLRRLLTLHRFLDEHPDALGGVPATWPAIGESVGDFELLRELGRGSFSRVYLASETTAGARPVALKVSSADNREADTLGPLSHPHLIPVLSSRAVGPWTVVAMPFAGTATLEDVLSAVWATDRPAPRSAAALLEAAESGGQPGDPPFPAPPADALRANATYERAVVAVAARVFAAVAYLHERGIAHRDLKPSNVLLGPGGHPYLLDFNLASRAADPWRVVGTLPYMAPEHLAVLADPTAPPPADGRPGDVFASGVVLFELLTGKHPFGAPGTLTTDPNRERVAAALLAAQRAGHPRLKSLNARVPRAVRAALERCLALDPHERPTAAELTELFARVGARRRVIPVLAGVSVLAAALALGAATFRTPEPAPAPPESPATAVQSPAPAALSGPFERGMQLLQEDQHALAAGEFLKAGKANNDGRAFAFAAYCLSAGRDQKGAIKLANDALDRGYRTAAVYANRAYNHLQTGNLQSAKADCDEALRRDPTLLAARYTRAAVALRLYLQSRVTTVSPEAIEDIDQATAGLPGAPDVWMTAAQLYLLTAGGDSANLNHAAEAVNKAVQTGKDPATLQHNPILTALAGHPVYEKALKSPKCRIVKSSNPHLALPTP